MGCTACLPRETTTEYAEMLPSKDFFSEYSLGPKLGKGSFAQVRVAVGRDSNKEEVAVKIIDLREVMEPDVRLTISQKKLGLLNRELTIWSSMKVHPNIVKLHDVFFCPDVCFMVMEKCGSSLLRHLESMDDLNEHTIGIIFSQMLQGISHVHQGFVVHRDIKADNFLIATDGHTVKLCDFGLSTALLEDGSLDGIAGTAPFMCPEMLKASGYDEKADIWSFGVLVYALLFGAFPYGPEKRISNAVAMRKAILNGISPTFEPVRKSDNMRSQYAITFVKALLTRDPLQRPCARDALHSPFMVMVREDSWERFMVKADLPSLRPMLQPCKTIGAFEVRNLSRTTRTDSLIEDYHVRSHGKPIHQSWPEMCDTRKKAQDSSASSVVSSRTTSAGSEDPTIVTSEDTGILRSGRV